MKFVAVLVLLSSVCACAPIETAEQGDRPEIELAFEAWMGAGLPDPTHCGVQKWAHVDSDTFNSICGSSCATEHGACTVACTVPSDPTIGYWNDELTANDPATESIARAHEQMHAWSECVFGDADTDHANQKIWDAAKGIENMLRKL